MKRGCPDHPKTHELARELGVPKYAAVGLLELMWHYAARFAIRGDIGKWSDASISTSLTWEGDPSALISALVSTGWLDRDRTHRLVIHDWAEHADQGVKKTLANRKEEFVRPGPTPPCVYFLRNSVTGRIKIGTTTQHPHLRWGNIQTSACEPIEFIGAILGNQAQEEALHEEFKSVRVLGEWFDPSDALVERIRFLLSHPDLMYFPESAGSFPEKTGKVAPATGTGRGTGKAPVTDLVPTNGNGRTVVVETPFDRFWTAYPKKVGKGTAEKAWAKLRPPIDAVLAAIAWQKLSTDWLRESGQFIPHPTTWLNRKGWLDEPPPAETPNLSDIEVQNLEAGRRWVERTS